MNTEHMVNPLEVEFVELMKTSIDDAIVPILDNILKYYPTRTSLAIWHEFSHRIINNPEIFFDFKRIRNEMILASDRRLIKLTEYFNHKYAHHTSNLYDTILYISFECPEDDINAILSKMAMVTEADRHQIISAVNERIEDAVGNNVGFSLPVTEITDDNITDLITPTERSLGLQFSLIIDRDLLNGHDTTCFGDMTKLYNDIISSLPPHMYFHEIAEKLYDIRESDSLFSDDEDDGGYIFNISDDEDDGE